MSAAINPTEDRRARGLAIAQTCRITQKDGYWLVPSQSGNGSYQVYLDPDLAPFNKSSRDATIAAVS